MTRTDKVIVDGAKLTFPAPPAGDDIDGLCDWLSAVFNLDRKRPIVYGRWHGLRGLNGHIELERRNARSINFEPVRLVNQPQGLTAVLSWEREASDKALLPYKGEHCRMIADVLRRLCDSSEAESEEHETYSILSSFIASAVAVEGYTRYGTSAQRYEAVMALRRDSDDSSGRPYGPLRYLIDANTGEFVIGVSDIESSARQQIGSSLPHGWIRARASLIGWDYGEVQGYGPKDGPRRGPHAHRTVISGFLPREAPPQTAPKQAGKRKLKGS